MRYLSLAEALTIAEAVTGTNVDVLARSARVDLLDSALHAPQAGFEDQDFYPTFLEKAAVLTIRIARNHPLLDGNKRLAWQSLTMFCALNGYDLEVPTDDAVAAVLAVAAGELDEAGLCSWLEPRVRASESPSSGP